MAAEDMEEIDVATKAPESDAQEPTQRSNSASVDQTKQPILGEHCLSDRALPPDSADPRGTIQPLTGSNTRTYLVQPTSYPSVPAKLLLLLSPGTGIDSTANRLQADAWADRGYVVVMPDLFGGDPAPRFEPVIQRPGTRKDDRGSGGDDGADGGGEGGQQQQQKQQQEEEPDAGAAAGLLGRLKMGLVETAKSFRLDMWLARHTPQTVLPRIVDVIRAAREMYADAVAAGGGLYAAGYCFGGRYVILLLGELPDDVVRGAKEVGAGAGEVGTGYEGASRSEEGMVTKGPWIKAGVLAHGTGVAREDFAGLKSGGRLGVVAVKGDGLFTDEVRKWGLGQAKEKGLVVEEKVWEGVPHGFAVVGEYKDHKIQQAQKDAFDMMADFLEKS